MLLHVTASCLLSTHEQVDVYEQGRLLLAERTAALHIKLASCPGYSAGLKSQTSVFSDFW